MKADLEAGLDAPGVSVWLTSSLLVSITNWSPNHPWSMHFNFFSWAPSHKELQVSFWEGMCTELPFQFSIVSDYGATSYTAPPKTVWRYATEEACWPDVDLHGHSQLSPERQLSDVDTGQNLGLIPCSDLRELTVVALTQEIFWSHIPTWKKVKALLWPKLAIPILSILNTGMWDTHIVSVYKISPVTWTQLRHFPLVSS